MTPLCDCYCCRIERLADRALVRGEMVEGAGGIVVIPDVVAVEAEANGLPPLPRTWTLKRRDGRVVRLFRMPPRSKRERRAKERKR